MGKIASLPLRSTARPRRAPRSLNRQLLDPLESRLLLSSTLLPILPDYGLIYDPTRNQLDIPGDNGLLFRYDVAAKNMLSPITVGGNLGLGDITPDGAYLYLTDRAADVIHKINLTTGADTDLSFTPTGSGERSAWDLKIISGNEAVMTNQQSGSGNRYPFMTLNLTTGAFGATLPGLTTNIDPYDALYRSADYSTLLALDDISTGNTNLLYNATTQTEAFQSSFSSGYLGAVSPNGSLLAFFEENSGATTLYNSNFQVLDSNLPIGAAAFSPTGDTLYIVPYSSPIMDAYDTTTFALKATYDVNEASIFATSFFSSSRTGLMAVSSDGNTVFLTTPSGVRAIALNDAPLTSTVVLTIAPTPTPIDNPVATVTVDGAANVFPTGTVQIFEGSTFLGSGTLHAGSSAQASATIKLNQTLSLGDHILTAVYSGDGNYANGTSVPITDTIALGNANVTSFQTNTATISLPPIIQANIAGPEGDVVPTGTAELLDGSTIIATAPLPTDSDAPSPFLTPSQPLSPGNHTLTVVYSGDANYASSTSAPINVTIQVFSTTTSLQILHLDENGITVGLMASVNASDGAPLGEPVKFYDGSTLLGTADSFDLFQIPALGPGHHSLTAVFSGNADYTASTSAPVVENFITPTIFINLLVLYTPSAADSVSSITTTIQRAITQTNQAMLNSDIPVQINLVDEHQVDYTETGNYTTDLTRLANPSDGFMDSAAALREQDHADLVSLFVGDEDAADQYIGLGSELENAAGNPNAAYTVVDAAFADQFVLAHEIGHNLGARHDTDNDTPGGFQTAHGYRFTGNDNILYHDIMSYAPGTTIPYYSNPNITYAGVPEGAATDDAAATMAQMAPIVANYSSLLGANPTPAAPQGAITSIANGTITGWGFDDNAATTPLLVRLDIDGATGTPFLANLATPDISATVGSIDHGFALSIPTSLANGTHTAALLVQDAPGNTFVQLAQQSFTVSKLPDLTVSVGSINKLLATYLPGDALSFPVTITNNGTLAAPAHTVVDVRLSTDSTYEDADPLLFQFTLPTTLAAGASKTFTVKAKLPTDLAAAGYVLVASVDPANLIAESDETNNTAAGNQSLNLLWQFGALPGRPGNHAFTFHDADGTAVTLHLAGPGAGTLTHDSNGYSISLANTSPKSALSITTAQSQSPADDGRFTLDTLSDPTPLHSLTARTTDLQSTLTLAASPASLTLGNVLGPSTITLGAGPVANLSFANIQNLALTDASPIRTFRASQWLSLNDANNSLAAPSINTLLIAGKRENPLAG